MSSVSAAWAKPRVRRLPWACWAIAALLVLVQLVVALAFDAAAAHRRVQDELRQSAELLMQHPHLAPDPALQEALGAEFTRALDQVRQTRLAGLSGSDDEDPAVRARLAALGRAVQEELARTPLHRLGFVPARPHPLAVLTSLFVHVSWLHLAGNLVILLLAGGAVQELLGARRFLVLYLLAGAAGVGLQALHDPASASPLVGASGAIAGLMGALLAGLLPWRGHAWRSTEAGWRGPADDLRAALAVPLWAAQQLISLATAEPGTVAWWAHLGGFVLGAVAGLALRRSPEMSASMAAEAPLPDPR